MLVLSRRIDQKILIPTIHASVQVVSIKPGAVRLGIEAPPEVAIFREEIAPSSNGDGEPAVDPSANAQFRELSHLVRNRLNVATVGLALLRRQIEAGQTDAMLETLDRVQSGMLKLQQQLNEKAHSAASQARCKKVRRALLVDDDRNESELLAGFLRMAGLEVVTAGDGDVALDYLRSQTRPDVVLLDMAMPRVDGPSTVRAIRREPAYAGLKIFAVTGHARGEFPVDDGTAGVDRWFFKPLNPEVLLSELNKELR